MTQARRSLVRFFGQWTWLLLAVGCLVCPSPAGARILKTRRVGQSGRPLSLTVGSGFEYEKDGEESEYGFPFLAEYGLTNIIKLRAEPSYILIRKQDGGSISGPGDLETAITFELPTERRHRPGLALEGLVKWPTARKGDLGTGKTDYTFGAIVSKEFVQCDAEVNAAYTWTGDPPGLSLKDTFEASAAIEWHLNGRLDLMGEAVTASGAGGRFRVRNSALGGAFANIGGPQQGQTESEFTLGIAEKSGEFLKFEQGVVIKSGGAYQLVFAWEWDFAGGR